MLVLSRKNRESVMVGGGGEFQGLLKVTVLKVGPGKVTLGFDGDASIPVHRLEIWEQKATCEPAETSHVACETPNPPQG